ncbi:MAG: hypothetical protein KKH28_01580 [Elusimicrobia bacterium]|nr:hypothetical protein [Elusimicrobiota bacterium]
MTNIKKIRKGDRVRDAKWGGKYTGTAVRTAGSRCLCSGIAWRLKSEFR